MLSMDASQAQVTFAVRRPRTSLRRKPRLGSYLFLKLDKANGSSATHTFHDRHDLKTIDPDVIDSKKGALLQEILVPNDRRNWESLQDEGTLRGSSYGYRAHNDASKADDSRMSHASKSSHERDKQRGLYESEYENANTREMSHESRVDFDASGKPVKQNAAVQKRRRPVQTKDLNQLVRGGHIDKVRCKTSLSNRTESNRGNATSRVFDDDINKDTCPGQGDNVIVSRGQHPSRNVCTKHDVEHLPRTNSGLHMNGFSCSKLEPRHGENRTLKIVGKRSPSCKVDGTTHHSDEGAQISRMENKKTLYETVSPVRKSPCVSEARRQQRRYTYTQETLDNEDTQKCREKSLGEDVISDSIGQSSPVVHQNMHGNCGSGMLRISDLNDTVGLQVPTVRKSSRVPKKRVFDGDEEEPLRRQRKKLEIEPSVGCSVNAEQDDATDMVGDNHLPSECPERECHHSNATSGPYLDEKKGLPLSARQRALRVVKEGGDPKLGTNTDLPDGLQPVLLKKQKENLSEAEQAIKKEEAAKRRKQQMERNAKEIQAVAIQKILGQESSRKKREEKLQRQRQEIEKEKQAASMAPAVNSIRWVMGPSGNVVSFSQDVELPKIFSGPCSYPQEREKCAGPSCNNAYKYRDSKTHLPLCSLQCYRAVQELPSAGPAF